MSEQHSIEVKTPEPITTDDTRKEPITTAPDLTSYGHEDLFLSEREPESDFDDEFLERL